MRRRAAVILLAVGHGDLGGDGPGVGERLQPRGRGAAAAGDAVISVLPFLARGRRPREAAAVTGRTRLMASIAGRFEGSRSSTCW